MNKLYLIWMIRSEIPVAFIEADCPQSAAIDFALVSGVSLVEFRIMDCETYCNIANPEVLGH